MKRYVGAAILVIVLGGFAGIQQYTSWSLSKPQNQASPPSEGGGGESRPQSRPGGRGGGSREAIPVLVATAVQKSVPLQIRAVGNVEPISTVSIKSQVTGVIMKASFKEGQNVKKGDLLFTIDPRPLEATLKQAEATLARDTAQLQNMREQARRYAELVKKQYVSQEQYDQIRANADAGEAVVQADMAAVENAKVQLSYCYIYSPLDGQLGTLLVNEGNLVRVNDATPLVVINQLVPINVTFSVPEQNLPDIKQRMAAGNLRVDAALPADEGKSEEGALVFIDNAVDRSTGTIKLKAQFGNGNRRLWPGQFVNVALTLSTQGDAVVVPSEAVQVGPQGEYVFVLKPDNRVEVRPVTIARTNEGESILSKGIQPGETVVREGQFLLGPGARVEVKDAQARDNNGPRRERSGSGRSKAREKGES
jgi:multidrug efflux system membrane fusion protein